MVSLFICLCSLLALLQLDSWKYGRNIWRALFSGLQGKSLNNSHNKWLDKDLSIWLNYSTCLPKQQRRWSGFLLHRVYSGSIDPSSYWVSAFCWHCCKWKQPRGSPAAGLDNCEGFMLVAVTPSVCSELFALTFVELLTKALDTNGNK